MLTDNTQADAARLLDAHTAMTVVEHVAHTVEQTDHASTTVPPHCGQSSHSSAALSATVVRSDSVNDSR